MMTLPTNLEPTGEITVGAVAATHDITLSWDATDQAAFAYEIASGSTGLVHHAATVESALLTHVQALAEELVGTSLKFRIRSWTADEFTASADVPWSGWSYFSMVRIATLAITAPAYALDTFEPTVTLDFTAGKPVTTPFTQRVWVVDDATGLTVADSGIVAWSGTYTVPNAILDTDKEYTIHADVHASDGRHVVADKLVRTPTGPGVVHISDPDASTFEQDRTIRFDYWVDAVDAAWVANYIYRREVKAGAKWKLVERSTVPFPGAGQANALTYEDNPHGNRPYEYSVRQAIDVA